MEACPGEVVAETEEDVWKLIELHAKIAHDENAHDENANEWEADS